MSRDIGIDLGSTKIVIYVRGRGIVVNEPSVIAKDTAAGRLIKFGTEAKEMIGRTPDHVITIQPVRDGVISRYDETTKMLQYYMRQAVGGAVIKPRVLVGVPVGVTEVERRAVFDAVIAAGAKRVYILEEPLLAALGAGLDVNEPNGNMVIDIGGGSTDIAVISMGKIVVSGSLRMAGDEMDQALIRFVRRAYHLNIGPRSAEEAKIAIGTIITEQPKSVEVRGRCAIEGLPRAVTLTNQDLKDALEEVLMAIASAATGVLENTPPELLEDIRKNGITLSGGGSMLGGIDTLIERATGYHVTIAPDPRYCAINGTDRYWAQAAAHSDS